MRIAKFGLAAALVLGAVLLTARPAMADAVHFYKGPHAVPSEYGGFCNITVRHFHTYKPDDPKVFRFDDSTYIFIGDPTAHGFTGPRIPYYGHHSIPAGWGGRWCFISGPHYHFYRPTGAHFNYHGGVYYYVGGFTDPWYLAHRRTYEPIFTSYYVARPGYARPVIYTPPPRVYMGPRVTVPVARYTGPTVRVGAPGIRVGVGAPGVRVGVGAPGVRVGVGAPGVRVGVGAPGARPGMAPMGARPGMAPMGARPGMAPMGARPGMAPMGARPGMAPMGARPGMAPRPGMPAARPMAPSKVAPAPRPMPAARPMAPAPRPMPGARPAAPAPRPAARPMAPAPRPAARPAPGRRP